MVHGWVWHRNRSTSMEREPTWRPNYIPSRQPTKGAVDKTSKDDRNKPPSNQPKKK